MIGEKEEVPPMKYADWVLTVPSEIANDPIWKLDVYQLALFAGDIGWQDVLALSKDHLMLGIADELHRALGLISANLAAGYSRSKALDRARFFEVALGAVRESRDWYYKSRHVLSEEVINHRMALMTYIANMLTPMIFHQRENTVSEEQAKYTVQSPAFSLDSEVPFA